MADHTLLTIASLFLAGLLAGEEFVIRYGVRDAIDVLDDVAHIELRQALIRRLRVLVPALYAPTALSAVAVAVLERGQPGFALWCLGVAALAVWFGITMFGTVPINEAAFEWVPTAPPSNWRSLVARWEQLNTVRCWAAVLAFAAFAAAVARVLAG